MVLLKVCDPVKYEKYMRVQLKGMIDFVFLLLKLLFAWWQEDFSRDVLRHAARSYIRFDDAI